MTDLGQTQRRRVTHVAVHVILVGLLLVFLGPFFWLVSTSFKTDTMMFKMPPQWIPNPITLEHYRQALVEFPALRYMGNTLIIVVFSTVGTVLSCAMGAYAFSRLKWPDRGFVFGLLMATMMIPAQVTMISMASSSAIVKPVAERTWVFKVAQSNEHTSPWQVKYAQAKGLSLIHI